MSVHVYILVIPEEHFGNAFEVFLPSQEDAMQDVLKGYESGLVEVIDVELSADDARIIPVILAMDRLDGGGYFDGLLREIAKAAYTAAGKR